MDGVADDLTSWVFDAPMNELLSLQPPSAQALATSREVPRPSREVLERYEWLIDHFSTTDLSQWATESLLLEHRWMEGREAAPCPEALMADRQVPMSALASQIAHRMANAREASRSEWNLALRMQGRAEELLREGRFAEAAALFDFAVSQEPDNAEAQNNLGFCLIPTDPERALYHLRLGSQLGYGYPAVNLHNQVLAQWLTSTPRVALALADSGWDRLGPDVLAGVLWSRGEDGLLTLCFVDDVRTDLATLCANISAVSGLATRHDWPSLAGSDSRSLELDGSTEQLE
jgi:hypothetical protein